MAEARENVARFPEIDGQVMERVIQYMHYKVRSLACNVDLVAPLLNEQRLQHHSSSASHNHAG